jgi:hypothetical protein
VIIGVIVGVIILVSNLNKPAPQLPESSWVEYPIPNLDCSVLLPGWPRTIQQPIPGTNRMMTCHVLELTKPTNCAFFISGFRMSRAEFNQIPVEQRFEGAKQGGLANAPGAKLVSERNLTMQGCQAREFVMSVKGQGKMITRVLFADTTMYVLLAGGTKFEPNSPDVVKFFDSFKLTGRK